VLQFSSVDMEEETIHLDPPSPCSSPQDELLRKDERRSGAGDTEDDKSSAESVSKAKSSLRLGSKKRKKSTSPQNGASNGADCESQTSQFSRTSSTCGYRESFGMIWFWLAWPIFQSMRS